MKNRTRAAAKYRVSLSNSIVENRHAIFQALICAEDDCLNHDLAEFILQEASWAPADFLRAYLHGELDG